MGAESPEPQKSVQGLDPLFTTLSIPLVFLGSLSLDLGISDPGMGVLRVAASLWLIGLGSIMAYVPAAGRSLFLAELAILAWLVCQAEVVVDGSCSQIGNFSAVTAVLIVAEVLRHRVTRPPDPRFLKSWTDNL